MFECCYKFKVSTLNTFEKNNSFATLCYLSREFREDLEYGFEISKNPSLIEEPEFKNRYNDYLTTCQQIQKDISFMNINEIFVYLMKTLKLDKKVILFNSGLSYKTMKRLEGNDIVNPDIRTVVKICVAFKLPATLSTIVFRQAGVNFRQGNLEDDALKNVVLSLVNNSLSTIDKYLTHLGHVGLGSKAEDE